MTNDSQMVLTEQERQLIACLRKLEDADEIDIIIRREGGAREIELMGVKRTTYSVR